MVRGTALVLALLVVAGCGSGGTKARRDAVNSYIANASNAQIDLVGRQAQIDSALQHFSLTRVSRSELAGLRSARADVARTLRRLRALHPPADARRLHRLLLQRFALQVSVIDELITTELYLPSFAAALQPLHAAAAGLRRDLGAIAARPATAAPTVSASGSSNVLASYAAAFGGYGDALEPVAAKLGTLSPPPILRPPYEAERSSLRRSVAACVTIRRALLRGDTKAANIAIQTLFSVSAELNGVETSKEQAAAAKVYDGRLRRIDQLAIRASRERERLVKLIG